MRGTLTLCLLLSAARAPEAEVVWNTIISAKAGAQCTIGFQDGVDWEWAVSFIPVSTYTLTSVALLLSLEHPPGEITIVLAADSEGHPGADIEKFRAMKVDAPRPTVYTYGSTGHPMLEQGAQYWVVARASNSTRVIWYTSAEFSPSNGIPQAYRKNRGAWNILIQPYVLGFTVTGSRPLKTAGSPRGIRPAPALVIPRVVQRLP